MLHALKRFVPSPLMHGYHLFLSYLSALAYGFPSEQMIVIGVTGTNGKSTTANLIASVLEEAGHTVGLTTTANFRIAGKEWLNDTKMTMLGRFALQKMLRQMVQSGCTHAVIETSSQGIVQFRHRMINYDTVVFTNLTPEHIEAHGGFENYKKAKLALFRHLAKSKKKRLPAKIAGASSAPDALVSVPKTIIANGDDEHAPDFLHFAVDRKYVFGIQGDEQQGFATPGVIPVLAHSVSLGASESSFVVDGEAFHLSLLGKYNISNALAAIAAGLVHGVPLSTSMSALARVEGVPGRLEFIRMGQPFQVLVDYAPEPVSLTKLYGVLDVIPIGRLIHVLGSCGGGRDIARRPILGEMAGKRASVVIVTNEDPYDDDPERIIADVAQGARKAGKIEGQDLFRVSDRREALRMAVGMAAPGDLVLATGKGSEQAICVADGMKLPWDEREELRKALRDLGYGKRT